MFLNIACNSILYEIHVNGGFWIVPALWLFCPVSTTVVSYNPGQFNDYLTNPVIMLGEKAKLRGELYSVDHWDCRSSAPD